MGTGGTPGVAGGSCEVLGPVTEGSRRAGGGTIRRQRPGGFRPPRILTMRSWCAAAAQTLVVRRRRSELPQGRHRQRVHGPLHVPSEPGEPRRLARLAHEKTGERRHVEPAVGA